MNKIHGLSYAPEYRAWQTMRLRCHVPSNPAYHDYGAREIVVCERWRDSVENFVADMGPKPSPQHEIDRIDNDGPYSPENCRWVTRTENCRNRRSNRLVTYQGETHPLAYWCERLSLDKSTTLKRIEAGWETERVFETPVRAKRPNGQGTLPYVKKKVTS